MELEEKFKPGVLVRFKDTTRAYSRNLGTGVVKKIDRDGVVTIIDIKPVDPLKPLQWYKGKYRLDHSGLEVVKVGMELITGSIWN